MVAFLNLDGRTLRRAMPSYSMVQSPFVQSHGLLPNTARIVRFQSADPLLGVLEESGRFGSFQFSFEKGILEWSSEMFRRYGFEPTDDISTDDSMERVHPEDRQLVQEAITGAVVSGSSYTMEYRVLRPDGEVFWLLTRGHIERNADGSPARILGIALDISALKKAEESERDARNQILSLVESVSAAFIAVNRQWRFTYVNSRVLERGGKSREELIGRNMWELFPELAASQVYPEYHRVMQERVAARFQMSLQRDGTDVIWYDVHAFPTAEGMAALIQDITDLKHTELELRATAERLQLAQRAGGIGSWEWDFKASRLHWSDELYELIGIPKTVTPSFENWMLYVHEDDAANVRESFHQQLGSPENLEPRWEYRMRRPDGRMLYVVGRGKVHRSKSGAPERMVGIVADITERRRAQEELELSEKRFREAQRAANIGAYDWDLKTNRVFWAARVPSFADVVPDGQFDRWLDHFVPEDKPKLEELIRRILEGGRHFTELRLMRPDGRLVWIYSGGEALRDAGGQATHIYGIAMDITERKLAEDALRKSEKLAATGRLAATIAHEINNPLEAVTNLMYLSLREPDLPERVRQFLVDADEELKRVASIVRQTLGFYRESKAFRTTNLSELVRAVLHLYRRRFETKHVRLITEFDMSLCAPIMDGEVKQVVTNFVTNALDATAPGGVIHARVWEEQGNANIAIEDDGSGISEESKLHLFEPFFTTKVNVGTGLGLWISKEIADNHGGAIEVQTSTGPADHGTTFVLRIPLGQGHRNQGQE